MKTLQIALLIFSLTLGGCASVDMQKTSLVTAPAEKMALVNFVRPAVFLGDGLPINVWHGTNYIGSLSAGSMIQHQVLPGKHLFLANAENWSYASADVQAGKVYTLKANIFPGIMTGRVALGTVKPDDPRLKELMELKPTIASAEARNDYGDSKRVEVTEAISSFEAGKISSYATVLPGDGK